MLGLPPNWHDLNPNVLPPDLANKLQQFLDTYNAPKPPKPNPPKPPTKPGPGGGTANVGPADPNALIGPVGIGSPNYIRPTGDFSYTVQFENDGSVAAQDVTVTEQLDPNLDWSTFQLGSFGFGSVDVTMPLGLTQYQKTVSYQNTDDSPLNVQVTLDFNVQTGLLTVTFTSLGPLTGQAPTGVFDGFLPPDNSSGGGEGFVQYTVQPKASLATGTAIDQQAAVVFDTNASLATNTFLNTIVGASTLLTDTTKQKAYTAVEGNSTKTQVLATFTDGNPSSKQSFTPTVSWGGTLIGTPTVSVKLVSLTKTTSTWEVLGSATYADPGAYGVAVVVQDTVGDNAILSSGKTQFTVVNAPLSDVTAAKTYNALEGNSTGTHVLTTFTDADPFATLSDFTPTVTWGGTLVGTPTVSMKQIPTSKGKPSEWEVLGNATYAEEGKYSVTVSVTDMEGSSLTSKKVKFNVEDAPLADVPKTTFSYTVTAGTPSGVDVLAKFTDANPYAPLSDYKVTVKWVGKVTGTPSVSVELVSRTETASIWNSTWEVVVDGLTYAPAGARPSSTRPR